MGRLLTILLLLVLSVSAEDLYVTDQPSGGDTGADCANAHSVSWLNTGGNWGAGANKVSAGDTVHLCGTITNKIVLQGSGEPASVITIKFETGAKMSAPSWGVGGIAMSATSLHDIVVDGGVNGLIECTDNGTAKTFQHVCSGVDFEICNNIEIKNLTTTNIYVRTPHSTSDTLSGMSGILLNGTTNLSIHNCKAYWSHTGIYLQFQGTTATNFSMYSNVVANVASSAIIGAGDVNVILDGAQVYHNDLSAWEAWDGVEPIHCDGFHIYALASGSRIKNLVVRNNYMHGDVGGRMTSPMYIENVKDAPLIYNNLIVLGGTNRPFDGCMSIAGASQARVYNNTFVGNNCGCANYAIEVQMRDGTAITSNIFLNNLSYNVRVPLFYQTNNQVLLSDTNVFFTQSGDAVCNACSPISFSGSGYQLNFYLENPIDGSYLSFGAWKATYGYDTYSSTNEPALDANYRPTSNDTVARGAGFNLSSVFTTDFNGDPRPASGAWTIGAFEAAGQSPVSRITIGTIRSGGIR